MLTCYMDRGTYYRSLEQVANLWSAMAIGPATTERWRGEFDLARFVGVVRDPSSPRRGCRGHHHDDRDTWH